MNCHIVAPSRDLTEQALATWGDELAAFSIAMNANCIGGVTKMPVDRAWFTSTLQSSPATIYLGHGKSTELPDSDNPPLADRHNIAAARNSVVLAIACDSSKGLGRKAIAAGVTSYLGFSDRIWVDLRNTVLFARVFAYSIGPFCAGGSALGPAAKNWRFHLDRLRLDPVSFAGVGMEEALVASMAAQCIRSCMDIIGSKRVRLAR